MVPLLERMHIHFAHKILIMWWKEANVVNIMTLISFQMSVMLVKYSPAWWEPPGLLHGFSVTQSEWGCDLISSTATADLWLQRWGTSPSRQYHLPPDSERKWWRSPLILNPLPLKLLPENQQPAERSDDTDTETAVSKQAKNKTGKHNCSFLFFLSFTKKKCGRCRGHSLLQKKTHLTSLLSFMSSGRTLTSQTGRRFCLLNQLGFLGGSGRSASDAWETFFLLFLVHHQILHPQWAWKVNNSALTWLSSLPLSHCSVNTRGLYRRPAEVKRVNKSEALHQRVTLSWMVKVCREAVGEPGRRHTHWLDLKTAWPALNIPLPNTNI